MITAVYFVKSACAVKASGRNGQVQKLKGAQQYLVLNFVGLLSFVADKGPLAISSGTSFGIWTKIAEVASFVDHQSS